MHNLDKEIHAIVERNRRVEADKAWETSWFRRLLIMLITYITACIFLTVTSGDHSRALLPAVVPSVAYLLSTLSLGPIKRWWIKKNRSAKS